MNKKKSKREYNPQSLLPNKVMNFLIVWGGKIGGSVFDQAVFAGSNFILNVLLVRWMSIEEYGTFVVIYAWFLLVQNIYEASLIEPMNIFGAGKYSKVFRVYLGYLYQGHIGFTLILSLITLLFVPLGFYFGNATMGYGLLTMALIAPFLLLRWLTRQPFYIMSKPHQSALGGLLYFIVTLTIYLILLQFNWLNIFTALIGMALGGSFASFILTIFLIKPDFSKNTKDRNNIKPKNVLDDHVKYGVWSSAARILLWLPGNINYIVFPIISTIALSAALRATMNLILPVTMAVGATWAIIMPYFVRTYITSGKKALNKRIMSTVLLYGSITVIYGIILVIFGRSIISFLFENRFNDLITTPYLITMALIPILAVINGCIDVALRSAGCVKQAFYVKVIPTILTVTLGFWLIWKLGLIGATLSIVIIEIINLGLFLGAYILSVDAVAPDNLLGQST